MRSYLWETHHATLLAWNTTFLATYRGAGWHELADNEPYLWHTLAYHLIEANRQAELGSTVKDLWYLARKAYVTSAAEIENDLTLAEHENPTDTVLALLRRHVTNFTHYLSRCSGLSDIAARFYIRLKAVKAFDEFCRSLASFLSHPYLETIQPLPDMPHPALIRTLVGHTDVASSCAYSPDGQFIVSASWDKTLKVWEASTGRERLSLVGQYIQACLLSQSLDQTPTTRKQIINRSIRHSTFYTLLGKTQIGSRAAIYTNLRQRVLAFMQNKLVYAEEAMQCLLDLLNASRSLHRKTFEKPERNAEIYRRYLAGEDSIVLARVCSLSDRRVRNIIEHERTKS